MSPYTDAQVAAHVTRTLRGLLRRRGYTQAQLATALGVKRPLVGAWMEGRSLPRLPQLLALSRLFGRTLEQLVAPKERAARKRPAARSAPEA